MTPEEKANRIYEKQIEQSLIISNDKLSRINDYLDKLQDLNNTSSCWSSVISKMKAIVMEE